MSTHGLVGTHAFSIDAHGDLKVNGKWRMAPFHNKRPSYTPYADEGLVAQWSASRRAWCIRSIGFFGTSQTPLYESKVDSATIPDHGWEVVEGEGQALNLTLAVAFTIKNCGDQRMNVAWAHAGDHNDRPQYIPMNGDDDNEFVIEYSGKRGAWRITTANGWWRKTLYHVKSNSKDVPTSGWEVVDGVGPAPQFEI
jgi:hypothetical protein